MATMTLSPSPSLSAIANGMIPGGPPLSSPTGSLASRRLTNRMTNRYSVTAMYSLAAEQDIEVEDDLLLIQNKIAADEKRQVAETLEELGEVDEGLWPDEKKMGQYANLFFLLQSEPRHVASLCRLVSLSEIDTLLQTVMFTLYGNQYEQREEHLLLTMFQVSGLTRPTLIHTHTHLCPFSPTSPPLFPFFTRRLLLSRPNPTSPLAPRPSSPAPRPQPPLVPQSPPFPRCSPR
jgi:Ras GTPase-activating-like protein IQGAP2/3